MPSLWNVVKQIKSEKTLSCQVWDLPRADPKSHDISSLTSYVHQIIDDRFQAAIADELIDLLVLDGVRSVSDLIGVWACLATGTRVFALWDEALATDHLVAPMRFLLVSVQSSEQLALDLAVYVATVLAETRAPKREITVLVGLLSAHKIRTLDALVAMFARTGKDAAVDILNSMWFRQCLAAGVAPIALSLWSAVEHGVYLSGAAANGRRKSSWVTMRKLKSSAFGVVVHKVNGWAENYSRRVTFALRHVRITY
ncbi:hypothetical protein HDU87_008607 [Geranomyces variabilis]|uniref:Uncharacterized protein n=1 Tax=Geranomyces variabilis TaxID=109894 RepID=A0AAD5TPH3_9FUNG|nr:hypothetical protein HDU87_008607 [Geranomyces variabilis]